eukprot:8914380-Pyramimonas_sp.AAC.1
MSTALRWDCAWLEVYFGAGMVGAFIPNKCYVEQTSACLRPLWNPERTRKSKDGGFASWAALAVDDDDHPDDIGGDVGVDGPP